MSPLANQILKVIHMCAPVGTLRGPVFFFFFQEVTGATPLAVCIVVSVFRGILWYVLKHGMCD